MICATACKIEGGISPRRRWILAVLCLLVSGCESLQYYAQAVRGQAGLLVGRAPIERLVADPDLPEPLRDRLESAARIRDFASSRLALPDNRSYRSYVNLEREAMVWSLVATPEFSVEPETWCFPVVGCTSYRGYFDASLAKEAASRLAAAGRDVTLEPVPAYSTLGWFSDPLPSTVIRWPDWRLAELIFHELAHQQLYVPDDSSFNEAFATTVAQVGVSRWLANQRADAPREAWQRHRSRERALISLLLQTRKRLAELYGGPLMPEVLRRRKALEWARLRAEYRALRATWGGYSGFDTWFQRERLNNARLASVATYEALVPAFLALLERENGDLHAFYAVCRRLGELSPERRRAALHALLPAAGTG